VRIGARWAAAALLALALSAPAVAQAAWPNDPQLQISGGANTPWVRAINWRPPPADPNIGWPAIAVVDSGLWSGSEDFAGYLDDESADCVGGGSARPITDESQVNDDLSPPHGTRVATLAAAPANGKGTVGVSPNSPLIVVRITNDDIIFNPACAFNYLAGIAQSGQLLVVNVSSELAPTPPARAALTKLIRAGALVVAAAGNSPGLRWPASESHVLAVGRGDPGANAGNSAGGARLDLVAPGGGLRLPDLHHNWFTGDDAGTSYAAPIVSGVAARVWGTFGDVTDPQVIAYLLRATASGRGKFSSRRGFGMVDLLRATQFPAAKVPQSDETEPNENPKKDATKTSCRRACTLHGLIASTDDPTDYWRINRNRCPQRIAVKVGRAQISVKCIRIKGRGGGTFVRVKPKPHKNVFAAYTLRVSRR
jgi:hypothetical protein